MAYDATSAAHGSTAFLSAEEAISPNAFDVSGRLGVFVGAAAAGAMAGIILGLVVGHVSPLAAFAGIAAACAVAGSFAVRDFADSLAVGQWLGAMLNGLHLVALMVWPLSLALAPIYGPPALAAALVTMLGSVILTRPNAAAVGRVALPGLVLASAGAYFSLFAIMAQRLSA